jgi:hypothetical protein
MVYAVASAVISHVRDPKISLVGIILWRYYGDERQEGMAMMQGMARLGGSIMLSEHPVETK